MTVRFRGKTDSRKHRSVGGGGGQFGGLILLANMLLYIDFVTHVFLHQLLFSSGFIFEKALGVCVEL